MTLKRKGARDVVRQTHARSVSVGTIGTTGCCGAGAGGNTPETEPTCSDFFSGGAGIDNGDDNVFEADAPLCTAVGPPSPPASRRASRSGSGRSVSGGVGGSRGGGDGSSEMSAVVSLEDAAQRIAVDPDSGHSYFVERSTVCDACPYCEDVCEVAWCNGCDENRAQLEDAYGPLMMSAAEMEAPPGARAGKGRLGRDCEGSGGNNSSGIRPRLAPVLSRRYPRKSSYTPCEVRRRKITGACWIVSQGSVYDVTAALEDHPGGKRSVLRNAGGKDCAEDFFFHSKAAKRQWRQYRIGSLVACRGEMADGDGDGGERSMRTTSDCVIS